MRKRQAWWLCCLGWPVFGSIVVGRVVSGFSDVLVGGCLCNVCGMFRSGLEGWAGDLMSGRASAYSDGGRCGLSTAYGGSSQSASNRPVVAVVVTMTLAFASALAATVRSERMMLSVVVVVKMMQIRCRFVELHVYRTVRRCGQR